MFPIFLLNFPKTLRVYQPTTLIPYHRLRQKLVKKTDDERKVMACLTERMYGK